MQRLRISFARSGAANYLSHLDMMRAWERTLRRAGWELAYSQGFNPHPKLSFAAALPVGVASRAEILDVHLEEPRAGDSAMGELTRHVPPGLEVLSVQEIDPDAPPIQRAIVAAEYEAICPKSVSADRLAAEAARVLTATSLPRSRAKEGKVSEYDLRPMIQSMELVGSDRPLVRMRLRTDAQGAGRADEVLRELGLDPADCSIVRTRLVLAS